MRPIVAKINEQSIICSLVLKCNGTPDAQMLMKHPELYIDLFMETFKHLIVTYAYLNSVRTSICYFNAFKTTQYSFK